MTKLQEYMYGLYQALERKDYSKVDILLARISNLQLTPTDFSRIENMVEHNDFECTRATRRETNSFSTVRA